LRPAPLELVQQFRHAGKKPRLAAQVRLVVREKFVAHRRVIGMLGRNVEPHAEQPPRAH
jgi:hypothetical protein